MSNDQIDFIRETLNTHTGLLGEIKSSVEELKKQQCPAPGLCLEIRDRVEDAEIKYAEQRGRNEGIKISANFVYALFTSGVMAMVYQWFVILHK